METWLSLRHSTRLCNEEKPFGHQRYYRYQHQTFNKSRACDACKTEERRKVKQWTQNTPFAIWTRELPSQLQEDARNVLKQAETERFNRDGAFCLTIVAYLKHQTKHISASHPQIFQRPSSHRDSKTEIQHCEPGLMAYSHVTDCVDGGRPLSKRQALTNSQNISGSRGTGFTAHIPSRVVLET